VVTSGVLCRSGWVGLCGLLVSCGGASASAPRPAEPLIPRSLAPLTYAVDARELSRLVVEAHFPAGIAPEVGVDEEVERFVEGLTVDVGRGPVAVPFAQGFWDVSACFAAGCSVRYGVALAAAAEATGDPGYAARFGEVLLAPPSTWLVRPFRDQTATARITVKTSPDVTFVTGLFPARDGAPGAFEAELADLHEAPYSAFGPLAVTKLAVPGGELTVAFAGPLPAAARARALAWVGSAADSVSAFYGRFPVPHALVLLLPEGDDDLGFARTLGNGGATILAPFGVDVPEAELAKDWIMTHEMIHLALPNVGRSHMWLEEGLATYVEPFARARRGKLSAAAVWRGLARGLPQGQPEAGDRGLDGTPTWGRKYWGGALFCLVADVTIRERTGGKKSLDDALRGILAEGGDVSRRWPIERALAAGDRATGVPVLAELYAAWANRPVTVDLDALFARLGVRVDDEAVLFDDEAPLAQLRRAMTDSPAGTEPHAISGPAR
jgi:predicted metalloprotease with PDZ domain